MRNNGKKQRTRTLSEAIDCGLKRLTLVEQQIRSDVAEAKRQDSIRPIKRSSVSRSRSCALVIPLKVQQS